MFPVYNQWYFCPDTTKTSHSTCCTALPQIRVSAGTSATCRIDPVNAAGVAPEQIVCAAAAVLVAITG